jgi:hypothetical protein
MSGLLAGTLARRALDDAVLVAIAPPTLMRSMAAGRRALRTRRQVDESGLAAADLYLRHTAGCRPRRLGPSRPLHMIHRARLASATEMVAAGFISQLFELPNWRPQCAT